MPEKRAWMPATAGAEQLICLLYRRVLVPWMEVLATRDMRHSAQRRTARRLASAAAARRAGGQHQQSANIAASVPQR